MFEAAYLQETGKGVPPGPGSLKERVPESQPSGVHKIARKEGPPQSNLQTMMDRMGQIEEQVADLHRGHTKLVDGHKAMEERLLEELAYIRKGLTLKDTPKPTNNTAPARNEAITLVPTGEETPSTELELTDLATLDMEEEARAPSLEWDEEEIDVPQGAKRARKKEIRRAPGGEALLNSLADKYGILLSNEAREAHHEELIETFRAQDQELRSLKRQLTEDKEAVNTHGNTTPEKRKDLQGKIRETEKNIAQLSQAQAATNEELDTYATYPTAAEEIAFNLDELIGEMERTKPTNHIRLQQLKNNFADLEQMQRLLKTQEASRAKAEARIKGPAKPWGWAFGKQEKLRTEGPLTETEDLAQRLGITLDRQAREDHLDNIKKQTNNVGTRLIQAKERLEEAEQDEDASLRDDKLTTKARKQILARREAAEREVMTLEEQYNRLGDEYSQKVGLITAKDEINRRIQDLREDRADSLTFADRKLGSERIADLQKLKALLKGQEQIRPITPPPLPTNEGDQGTRLTPDVDETNFGPAEPEQRRSIKTTIVRNDNDGEISAAEFLAKHGVQNIEQVARETAAQMKIKRYENEDATQNTVKKENRRTGELYQTMRDGINQPNEEETLLLKAAGKKHEEEKERARNVAVYQKRAEGYQTELKAIADKLAERGEFVEVPGQSALAYEAPKKSLLGSIWTRITEATTRRDVAALKKQYEAAMDRYEETQQLLNAVQKDSPVFAKNWRGERILAEKDPNTIAKRQQSERLFEENLKKLEDTEELAKTLMDTFVLNKTITGKKLNETYNQQAMDLLTKNTLSYRTTDQDFNTATLDRRNAIPITILQKVASGEEFKRTPVLSEDERTELKSVEKTTLRALQILEAKASVGKTKEERTDAQKGLNGLKKEFGGKTLQETAARATFMLEAAERVASMEVDNEETHLDLIFNYAARVRVLQDALKGAGKNPELITSLYQSLKQAMRETSSRVRE